MIKTILYSIRVIYFSSCSATQMTHSSMLSVKRAGRGRSMRTSGAMPFLFDYYPRLEVVYNPESGKKIASEIIEVEDFIGVKSIKAKGKRVTTFAVDAFNWLSPLKPDPEPSDEPEDPEAPESSDPSEIDDRLGYAEGTQTQLF